MKTIGITGPTGCGKTTFLQEIAAHGGVIVDCDALYYELLKTDPALKAALQKAFGNVFLPDGSLDRKSLAARVFSNSRRSIRSTRLSFFTSAPPSRSCARRRKKTASRCLPSTRSIFSSPAWETAAT